MPSTTTDKAPRDAPEAIRDTLDATLEADSRSTPQISEAAPKPSIEDRPLSPSESNPPLPLQEAPPLPDEAPPQSPDDGWHPVWDDTAQAYYFYNKFTKVVTWNNPRCLTEETGIGNHDRKAHVYNPAVHGDYDPTADYAQESEAQEQVEAPAQADENGVYTATGQFNRFTGRWQASDLKPENYNDEAKSSRQMSAFFDTEAFSSSNNGKSLKAERAGKKLSKKELKQFKDKRRERKEEKRRAWLRD
ncbi:MAG: hypothetical protein M1814_002271 [Vezdaea aestivalis]|nr:MAG: hypothetical protein M1814_002271 [Vezdaea aestivalis]